MRKIALQRPSGCRCSEKAVVRTAMSGCERGAAVGVEPFTDVVVRAGGRIPLAAQRASSDRAIGDSRTAQSEHRAECDGDHRW